MAMTKNGGWWESISNFLTKFNGPGAPPSPRQSPATNQGPTAPPLAPQQQEGDSMGIITASAKRMTLALLLYKSNWRYVEPYSLRARKNGTMDLMMFCHRHQRIEAFKPGKLESVQMTDIGFKPRWPIELGRD